jgi:uncharacterized protein (TIGR00255 family)
MDTTITSMTGFAQSEGSAGTLGYLWELRGVNGRGLDLRFRLPPGCDALEPRLREAAGTMLRRGNIVATLTLRRETRPRLEPDGPALEAALALALDLARRIPGCPPPRAEALLALPGVLRAAAERTDLNAPEAEAIGAGFAAALAALHAARRAEGARLGAVLASLLDEIAALHEAARATALAQPAAQRARLAEQLAALLAEAGCGALSEERLAQEVALLATRADVREELDRLESHLAAARSLLGEPGAIGRRFDFLIQEFQREANTLCSKSATAALTALGLRLKACIEKLREQVQNIE